MPLNWCIFYLYHRVNRLVDLHYLWPSVTAKNAMECQHLNPKRGHVSSKTSDNSNKWPPTATFRQIWTSPNCDWRPCQAYVVNKVTNFAVAKSSRHRVEVSIARYATGPTCTVGTRGRLAVGSPGIEAPLSRWHETVLLERWLSFCWSSRLDLKQAGLYAIPLSWWDLRRRRQVSVRFWNGILSIWRWKWSWIWDLSWKTSARLTQGVVWEHDKIRWYFWKKDRFKK